MALRRGMGWGAVPVLLAALLAGCDDPAPRQAPAAEGPALPQGRPAAALQAAEERLRARLRIEGEMRLRAVQAYRQLLSDTLAICGQVHPSGRGDEPWLPWVAVVGFDGQAVTRADLFLAASTPEATRVYFEMVDRCFDGGGPASPRQGIRPLPPAPSSLPRSAEDPTPRAALPAPAATALPATATPMPPAGLAAPVPPVAAEAPATAPAAGPAQGMITTSARTPVNVRAAPLGGSEVLRVVPRASPLEVYGEAPGGWLQVGEGGEAWGWLHRSMVER